MKKQLAQHYQEKMFFFTVESHRLNIVCFVDIASTILSEQWYKNRKENFNDKKVRIITKARNLNTNEIRCIWYETNINPSKEDIE